MVISDEIPSQTHFQKSDQKEKDIKNTSNNNDNSCISLYLLSGQDLVVNIVQ